MKPILNATQLNKVFPLGDRQSYHALKNVAFTVYAGEFVAIMGPSGSGKSTLLYQVAGMDQPTSGSVQFDNMPLHRSKEEVLSALRLEKMGFVFQQSHLLKDLTLFDNVLLPGFTAKKKPRQEVVKRARELFVEMGIDHIADHRIHEASGGQLQRVSIARALINDPQILFGDEPTGALDSSASKDVMDIFSRINERGTTVLMVTHDARVAARAHRVLFMADGEILSEMHLGRPSGDHPASSREEKLTAWLLAQGF